jgi:hypothetical protein
MRQPRLTEVACWAHARRNIYEVYESTASPLAKEALERIVGFGLVASLNRPSGNLTGSVLRRDICLPLGDPVRAIRPRSRASVHGLIT